ncbi:signal peptidase II [Erysipelothrix urinaevulpis]|uniref:signal peptidase II n=1 Tax=Erysipelothrix urinaevulpis TaxID=2683717 RepID=UPI001358D96D|nr:signal peptidase II [Erysipelothrix urinaevulpis]
MKKKSLVLAIFVLGIDLISKHFAQVYLENSLPFVVIPNFFELTYMTNTGAAWSILEGKRLFFILIASTVSIVLVYYIRKEEKPILMFALSLMLAGTLGNLIDRIAYGFVRDMLSFNLFGYHFPVFNIADSSLVIGVGLIMLDMILEERRNKHAKISN